MRKFSMVQNLLNREIGEELKRRKGQFFLKSLKNVENRGRAIDPQYHDFLRFGLRYQTYFDLGYEAKGAFRPNEEMTQVIAGRILDQSFIKA